MKTHKYIFRVDSSSIIGSGHVMRCLALAESLNSLGCSCTFISRNLDGNINNLIKDRKFPLIELPKPKNNFKDNQEIEHASWLETSWEHDAEETIEVLKNMNYETLIVDHYALWLPWEKKIKDYIKKIFVIDDLGDREHYCDYILDHNLGTNEEKYMALIPKNCKTMFGTKYALINQKFSKYRNYSIKRRNLSPSKKLLINFGGGDPQNYIMKIIDAIRVYKLPTDISIEIILGPINSKYMDTDSAIKKIPNEIHLYKYKENMAEFLSNIDLVIGAAGSSSWERCCLGVPAIMFSLAYNQNDIGEALLKSGSAVLMTDTDIKNGNLIRKVKNLFSSGALEIMSEKALQLVDGKGIERVIGKLNE